MTGNIIRCQRKGLKCFVVFKKLNQQSQQKNAGLMVVFCVLSGNLCAFSW